MLPKPHGGRLVQRIVNGSEGEKLRTAAAGLPRLDISPEIASDIINIGTGAFSPLEGFLGPEDLRTVMYEKRLANGIPWTIPIVLDITPQQASRLGEAVGLWYGGKPLAILEGPRAYLYDRQEFAKQVFGTDDPKHPGVEHVLQMHDTLLGGNVQVIDDVDSPFSRYRLTPLETRVLFGAKGWQTVVGFQTRNVPHLGHEYVQKTALTFVDGLFINPVIGRKKLGDFTDELILSTYETLVHHYYLAERTVLATLHTEMRYAGPREAIFHAIVRKNFGCTHFIVGRDHAGVGSYYDPYAAHRIFEDFPDLGITPLFFSAFFYCRRCVSVVNEKTCPHNGAVRMDFSGTLLRQLLTTGQAPEGFIRPEVAEMLVRTTHPFVEAN